VPSISKNPCFKKSVSENLAFSSRREENKKRKRISSLYSGLPPTRTSHWRGPSWSDVEFMFEEDGSPPQEDNDREAGEQGAGHSGSVPGR